MDTTPKVLAELAETEQVYLKDLSAIIHGYQRQLQVCGPCSVSSSLSVDLHLGTGRKQDCLTEDELDMIFGNMEELHAFHSDLCAKIKDCVKRCPQMIGKVFVEMGLDRKHPHTRVLCASTLSGLCCAQHLRENRPLMYSG